MKNFSQKFLITLFLGLFLGGCSLEFREESNVGSVDYTIYDNLDTVYRTISLDGVHETTNQTMLTFDMDKNIVAISTIGKTTTNESYTMEILSEDGATNATFQLHGTGRYNGKYLGMSILTNTDGSFIKFHIQDRDTVLQETTSDMIYYNYASDSMIFRHHKKYLNQIEYKVDGAGAPVASDSLIATINDAGEYLLNDEKIDNITTTIYALSIDTPATEIMTKADGTGYVVISYDDTRGGDTKIKKLEVESYADISRSSVDSALVTAAYYQYFGDIYKVANEILATMSENGENHRANTTMEIDGDYYTSGFGCFDVQFTGTDVSILCTGTILGTATFDNIVANSTLTINGDNYKYIKYTLTGESDITRLSSSWNSYADRDMLLMVKTDANGNFTKDSEMLVHFQIDERFYESADNIVNIGGSESWTVENSAELFAYVDGTGSSLSFDIGQHFNYNMPVATKPFPVWIETVYNNTYNGKYITFSADATEVYVGHTQEGSQNQTTYTYKYYNARDWIHVYENGGNTISFDGGATYLYDNAQTGYYMSTDNSRVEATIDNVKDKSAIDKDNTDRTFLFSADGDSVEYKGKKYYYNRSSEMFIDYRYGLNEFIAFNTFTDTGGKYSYDNNGSRESGTFTFPTVADEILAAMYGQTFMAQQTVQVSDKYYADQENTIEYSQRFTDAGIELWVLPNKSYNSPQNGGTATEANIVKYGSLTTSYGDTYKYIKYTYTSGQVVYDYPTCTYINRDMIVFAKVDASGKVTADSEVFVHLEQTGDFGYFDTPKNTNVPNSTTAYGGNQNIDLATSKKIFDYIDGGDEVDLRPYFNFNMPSYAP